MNLSTLERGLLVLEMLMERDTISVRELAAEMDLSRSSAYRIISTLRNRNWVVESSHGSYELGPALFLARNAATRQLTLRKVAQPWMQRLAMQSGETVTLSILLGNERVPIDQIESQRDIRMTVALGVAWPLYAGATGRAILAAFDPVLRQEYLDRTPLVQLAPNTVLDRTQLEDVLNEASRRGFSVSKAERDAESFAVSSPIMSHSGVVGAITICGPASRFPQADLQEYGEALKQAASEISEALEGPGRP